MGRFKIYDQKNLVAIQEDARYAKCLVCDKVLKNIMGNIKRHYEQIHDTVLDATIKSKKKSKKQILNDSAYTPRKINKKSKTNKPSTTMGSVINVDDYDWINEYQLDCESRPAITIVSTPSGNKIYQQLETRKLSINQDEVSPAISQAVNQNVNEKLTSKTLVSDCQIHNIQILSIDCHKDAATLQCMLTRKTPLNIPLNDFNEGSNLQAALQSWSPDKTVGVESKAICQHLDTAIKSLRDKIKHLASNRLIYLKLDIAYQPTNLMLVHIQFLNDFEIQIFTLGALELLDDHNAPVLKGKLLKALKSYDIDINQVFAIIKDYTSNIRKANGYLKDEETQNSNQNLTPDYCQHMNEQFTGHVLHFVACDIIKQLHENISQSRDAAKALRNCMPQYNLKPIPMLDNTNSWISVYDMIKSLLDIREQIEHNAELHVEIDWIFISKFVTSFKPVIDTTLNLQSNPFIMGDLYRDWLVCEGDLEELSISNELALYLLQALRRRKVHLFENASFLAALYLDPRFCYMGSMHLNDKQKKMAITQLLDIFNKLKSLDKTENISGKNTKQYDNKVNERYLKLEKKMAANMGINNKMKMVLKSILINGTVSLESVDSQSIEEALEQLQFDERLPFHANILDYWKTIAYKNPVMARLAEIALAAPATQTTVNRVFTILPVLLTKHKSKISLDNLESIFLLQLNKNLVG